MFRFLLKTASSLRPAVNKNPAVSPATPCLLHLKSLSTSTTPTTTRNPRKIHSQQSPISSSDYLVSSLGLSPESALKIPNHKRIDLKSTTNADSVVALFKEYGFAPTHLAKMFSLRPLLLSTDPHKTLKPKLQFFAENGVSGDALVHILTTSPDVLQISLQNKIVPCFNFLKTFFFNGNTQGLVSFLLQKRGPWILRYYSEKSTAVANVETLRRYGLPDSNILRLLVLRPQFLSRAPELFNDCLREVREMGFDPSSLMFVYGVRAFTVSRKDRWVLKMEVFKKRFGWTDQQVVALFLKQPTIMGLSEKKLKESVELLTKRLHWTADDIAHYPRVLHLSLEKRILPRYCVLENLMSRGLLERTCWQSAYTMTEGAFLRKVVNKYQEAIPQLLEIYQKK